MADRSIKIIMSASVTGLVNGFKTAQTAAKNLNTQLMQNEQAARDVTTGLGLIGGAAIAGAGLAIKTFASFDKQMSAVKATGGATAAELTRLREKAVELGASTSFSASEAAAGIENMLKAGVSAQDTLGGGLKGALDLAASGALSVADAAEIAAGTMTQFKLGGEDVAHIADVLSAGAGKAQGNVADLAGALKYAGVPVAQLGVSLEETTGTLALFASNAIVGEQAGTSLRSMVSSLTSPSKLAAKEMEKLSISAFDGQGKFIGLAGVAEQLKTRMSGLTDEERANSLGRIFGNESLQAANVLYDAGAEKVQKWTKDVNDQGYAAKTAAARLDNLSGDLEAFGGAMESAFIKAGSGGNDVLRGLTQGATNLVNALGSIDGSVLSGLTLALGGGGVLALGAGGIGKLAIGLNNANTALKNLGVSWKTVGKAATIGGGLVGVAAVGLQVWAQEAATARSQTDEYIATLDTLGQVTDETMRTMSTRISEDHGNWVQNIFGKNPGSILEQAKEIGVATEDVQAAILGNKGAYDKVTAAAERYAATNEARVAGTMLNSTQYAERFTMAIDDQSGRLSDAQKEQALKTEADKAAGLAQAEVQANYQTTTGAIDEQVASLESLIAAQQEAAGVVLSAREAQRSYQESLDAAKKSLKDNGKTLDAGTEKGRANQESLDGIAESALKVAETMEKNGASQEKVQGAIKKSRKQFVDMATDMGMPIEKARRLADELGLVPGNYTADVEVNTAAAEAGLRDFLTKVEQADGTLKIKGDGAPAEKTLDDVTTQVNEADGSVTIRAKDGKAIATLSDYTATVDESDGTVAIKGKDKQGRETVLKLTSWVGEQSSAIKVGADTKDAKDKVAELRKQVINLPDGKITITAKTQVTGGLGSRSGGLPWGDGEGAGWTGGLPHGVSQMSKAVTSMDPSAHITSGYRPGAITATGYPSYHGMGRAIDIVSGNMGRTFDMLRSAFGSKAKELYYTPRGFIRNGRPTNDVAASTRAMHYSHVHLALANGGKVTGPGSGTSDDIPAWLSNGEHVWTAEEVRRAGGQDAVYALRRNAMRGGLKRDPEAFATGGAVGAATKGVNQARRELRAERADLDSLKQYLRAARKKKREKQVNELEGKISRQERAVDKAEERLSKARERLSSLNEARTDFAQNLRRGEVVSAAASGISGANGVVDEMLGLARSGNLTRSQSNRLAAQARKAETAMRGLYKEVDKVDKRLESAAARTEKLQGISDGVKNALMGEQNLSDAIKEGTEGAYRDVVRTNSRGETWTEQMWDPGTKDSVTAKGLVANATSKAAKLKSFASKLNQLRAAGLSGVVIEEVAGLGSEEGMLVADALLKDKGQIKTLNSAYRDIAKSSGNAGEYVTDAFSKGGLSAAKSFEAGLEKQKSSLEKRIYNWGVVMANGLQAALTGKKTGVKKRAMGGPVSAGSPYLVGEEGPELIVPQSSGHVMTAQQTRYLATTAHMARSTAGAATGGPSVNFQVENITATDVNAAVDRMTTKAWDAINTHGIYGLAQGVGV